MRHFSRLNRVGYGILGQRRPGVEALLEQTPRALGEISDTLRRLSSIARPSHGACVESQQLCVRRRLASQIMCAGNGHLLHVGPSIIARRYT
jgi:hypothetical protein